MKNATLYLILFGLLIASCKSPIKEIQTFEIRAENPGGWYFIVPESQNCTNFKTFNSDHVVCLGKMDGQNTLSGTFQYSVELQGQNITPRLRLIGDQHFEQSNGDTYHYSSFYLPYPHENYPDSVWINSRFSLEKEIEGKRLVEDLIKKNRF